MLQVQTTWIFGFAEIISILALVVSVFSFLEARKTRKLALPKIKVSTIVEGFDTRNITRNILWYWHLRISNEGGKTVSLQGLKHTSSLPIVTPVISSKLLQQEIPVRIHLGERPLFEEIRKDQLYFNSLAYKSYEELQAINLSILSGETKAFIIVLNFDSQIPNCNQYFINLSLKFNNNFEYSLSKAIKIAN